MRRKRPVELLFVGAVSLLALLYIIFFFPPEFGAVFLFFPLLFITCSSFAAFALKNMRRGMFVGLVVSIYLLLRMNNLTNPFFLLILIAIFWAIELFLTKKY